MIRDPKHNPAYVRIFDTTLRDGEQSPGATMTSAEKLQIARALARMGVDVIEAGFPAASPDDLEAVRRIAIEVGNPDPRRNGTPVPIIAGLARAVRSDIDAAWEAVRHAARPRIHTFLATSPIHMQHKLRMTPQQVVQRVREMVAYAKALTDDVEFSPEDAGRSEPEFLYEVLAAAIEAGATTLNIPDTVGYTTPEEFYRLIRGIMEHVPGIEQVVVSVQCHNDLGLATANTLAGLMAGARQAEVTINGIGERAGNTALEEVVMALRVRHDAYGLETGIDTTQIVRVSQMVARITGMVVQPNKAIVGANAFAHEAGIHQDGMLKHHQTYEIMRPEMVGWSRSRLVLGKHSGRHALRVRLEELGYKLSPAELDRVFRDFKRLADRKKTITDADLQALVSEERGLAPEETLFHLEAAQVVAGTGMPSATVRLRGPDGGTRVATAVGTGPVDAVYKAIEQVVGVQPVLLEYVVNAVTEGIDAVGEVSVRIQPADADARPSPQGDVRPRTFGGYAADTDIILASAKAYLAALNKLLAARQGEPASTAAASSPVA